MSLSERTGFFAEYYLNLKNSLAENFDKEIEKITACQTDFDRVKFVDQLEVVRTHDDKLQVHRVLEGKDAGVAAKLKEDGNTAFKSKKWLEAMILYTKSYVALPADRVSERAVILANRSAALYHMQKFDETLIDIKRSMDLGYPKDLLYKLYERQARCYLAKHNYPKTIEAFKKCITAMDDANLSTERRSKLNLDAMTMIKMLEKDTRTAKQSEMLKKSPEEILTMAIPDEKEFTSSAIEFDQNRTEGRFVRAGKNVGVGEEILVERPFVAVLLEKYAQTHCQHCFVRTAIPVACPKCPDVVFCSEKCLKRASSLYHKYECGLLPAIWRSGASINCHMALRIVASQPLEYFLGVNKDLDKDLPLDDIQKLTAHDYRRVAHLVRHETKRSASNFFQHALMARFLTKCLEQGGYFASMPSDENFLIISSIVLRNLQFIQFNTHEVAELHKSPTDQSRKTKFIGGALYPTLALFNHSCDPGVVRYFRGTTIHVNTVKPIEAGLPICENYGPIYTQEERDDRQRKLQDLYWFDCTCDPCLENWPTFDKLSTDVARFRCDAPNQCRAIIEISGNCNDFMIKCVTCGECTNIFKGLKVMQDTELMTRTAKRLYDAGDYSKALNKFIDLIRIMYEVLAPPFPDFCACQQYLRDCFLHFGNFYEMD